MKIENDVNIGPMLSLGIGGSARYFCTVKSEPELLECIKWAKFEKVNHVILAGGTNCLIGDNFDGLVIKIEIEGIEEIQINDELVSLDVKAGNNLDVLVAYSIERKLWGLENLSLIPGSVGATPVQNVGAFGQAVSNLIDTVKCLDTNSLQIVTLKNSDCEFTHRKSIFNTTAMGRYIILSVTFILSKKPKPLLHRKQLHHLKTICKNSGTDLSLIRNEIIKYRTNGINLPNEPNLGSAGTFFQTALVPSKRELLSILIKIFANCDFPSFLKTIAFCAKNRLKSGFRLPSKLLIIISGAAGTSKGAVSLMKSNPAVLIVDKQQRVNLPDIVDVINEVRHSVHKKTGVKIPIEPTLINLPISQAFSSKNI